MEASHLTLIRTPLVKRTNLTPGLEKESQLFVKVSNDADCWLPEF
jgi:hypothetical protein